MILLVVLLYILVTVVEFALWPQRSFKEYFVYVVMMLALTTLSILLILNPRLPSPDLNKYLEQIFDNIFG